MRMKMMEKIRMVKHSRELSMVYGFLIFLALTLYFLLMYAVGLIHVVELRFVNIFFMIAGTYFTLRQYREKHGGELNYFKALALGTATGSIATTAFGIFLFLFLQLEGNLMESIRANEPIGHYLNPYMATFVVIMEGGLSGFGVSYILVNYMNTDTATKPTGGQIPTADHHGYYGTKEAPQS